MSERHSNGYGGGEREQRSIAGAGRPAGRIDLVVGLFQVGGAVFSGLLAFIIADTAPVRLAIVGAAGTAVLLAGATYQLAVRRRGRWSMVMWGQVGGAVLLLATTMIVTLWPGLTAPEPAEPPLVAQQRGYELRRRVRGAGLADHRVRCMGS